MNHSQNFDCVVPLAICYRHDKYHYEANQKWVKYADHIFLDRIDIQIEIVPVSFEKISERADAEPSSKIRERVMAARAIQAKRFESHPGIYCNAQMNSRLLHQYAVPNPQGLEILKKAMTKLNLSARAYDRILKVSRTIADLAGSEEIESCHIAEAIHYRNLDRESWGI